MPLRRVNVKKSVLLSLVEKHLGFSVISTYQYARASSVNGTSRFCSSCPPYDLSSSGILDLGHLAV